MNEQRQEAYLNLIQSLLSCPSGEESQILNAHQNLIDAGLVEALAQVTEVLQERGDQNAANFLDDLAHQLVEALGLRSFGSSLTTDSEPQLTFLKQVLQTTADGSPQTLYQLLQGNLDQLNDNFVTLLREWAATTVSDLKEGLEIAPIIGNFSSLISQFPLGNTAINQEIAIVGYEAIATVFTRETLPQYWAMNQGNLGTAYYFRIRGDRAENLEKAIRFYEAALEVYTRQAFPQQWAMIQNNLGDAYRKRIQGEKAENLEAAIRCGQSALEVRTRRHFPKEWAATQNNLGLAYWERIWGERAENLEVAIACYQAALEVRTREESLQHWADTQNNLGLIYVDRIRGKRDENLEAAIRCYEAALEIRTLEAFPYAWAETQNNLGNAYYRLQKQQADNLDRAIHCYREALRVYTREALPEQWAMVQNNLGEAYRNRIHGDKAENMEAAIACFSAALQVYSREAFPKDWAMVHNGLGISYLNRVYGEQSENLHLAIDDLSKALDIRTCEAFPQDYAVTQFNLGVAYEDAQQFPQARDAFAAAIDTVEFLRGEIVSGVGNEIDKTNLAESWNDLYRRMVEVCLRLGYNDEALEYVERSKTRNLVELIFSRDFNSLFPPDVASQLQQLQREIVSRQSQLQTSTVDNPTALVQRLQQLRQQQKVIQDRYFPIGAGFKLNLFRQTLGENTALVQWYFTSDGFQTFIITRHSTQPIVLSYDAAALQALEKWARAYLRLYSRENSQWWRIQLQARLRKLAEILQLDKILAKLPQDCDELILVPHQALHLFPLHALPVSEKSCLVNCFPQGVRYAPSCQLLQLAQTRQRSDFTRLFAVQNPTGDLAYTDVEIPAIERYFESADTRKRSAATKSAICEGRLNDAHCVHFSCHGYFNLENPLLSSLLLADCYIDPAPLELDSTRHLLLQDGRSIDLSKCLTLADLFTLDLRSCCLVTLSACETGFIDFRSLSDEYIGVPSGFIYAGSPTVVSSLWRVDDIASALLMIRFYQNLQTSSTVAVALNTAQTWLRDTNTAELQAWVRHLDLEQSLTKQIQRYLLIFDADEQLFSNPYYWAAFCAIGQ